MGVLIDGNLKERVELCPVRLLVQESVADTFEPVRLGHFASREEVNCRSLVSV